MATAFLNRTSMKNIFIIASLCLPITSVFAQIPACCSQPGACQSYSETFIINEVNKNSFNLQYSTAQSSGYILMPNDNGDTVYTPHRINLHTVSTLARIQILKKIFLNMRLPYRYVNNYHIDSNYGIGDAFIGCQFNSEFNRSNTKKLLITQFSFALPSGRSFQLDTANMYRSLIQTGTGNLNLEIGARYLHQINSHQFMFGATYRKSVFHLHNYKNGSLLNTITGYAYTHTRNNTTSSFHINFSGEYYSRDVVNEGKAYNSGYVMCSVLPRIDTYRKRIGWYSQLAAPLYRNYFGRQLKLNYTFTTGLLYGF
jgi:hypothetical protein